MSRLKQSVKDVLDRLDNEIGIAFDKIYSYLEEQSYSDLNGVIDAIEEGHVSKQLVKWLKDIAEENKTSEDYIEEQESRMEDERGL